MGRDYWPVSRGQMYTTRPGRPAIRRTPRAPSIPPAQTRWLVVTLDTVQRHVMAALQMKTLHFQAAQAVNAGSCWATSALQKELSALMLVAAVITITLGNGGTSADTSKSRPVGSRRYCTWQFCSGYASDSHWSHMSRHQRS